MVEKMGDPEMTSPAEAAARKVFVVLNPVAGLTDANSARQIITQACNEQGWECQIHETSPEDDVRGLVRDAIDRDVDLVIAAGGDGTVSAVVSGMVNSEKPMGILPAGTGNALARDLGLPLSLAEAMALLLGPNKTCTLDIMKINGDYYVLNVSIGISSKIMRETGRQEKRRFGMLAYIWHALESIVHSDMQLYEAEVDGNVYRFWATEVMITKTRLLGIPIPIEGVEINSSDGRLDLFIVRARGVRDYLNFLGKFIFRRTRGANRTLKYLQIQKMAKIQSNVPQNVQADGEEIGQTPVELELIPNALVIIVP